ncbi:cilia- and flagella-associated protein 44 [Sitophilus oryzae]|uniref:Cilia- and flagella-associated protein 44 n=1 Tax=Sitophilus oryzae TaxID=7048 RepID=A0A6J2XG73_SITOR|nr:cilia- and flagella-associated protein 44 [Sitophilus oryzae]XP_030750380.1 cilia- and flagella-associated protein 44 [Sitophilus oryzae]
MSDTEAEAENLPDDEAGTGEDESEWTEEAADTRSVYDPDQFLSGPTISEDGTLNLDILEFDFSFGYDCQKYFNLTVLDENTIIFSSGNFINFFDVTTRVITFRRSALGGGIGHIRKNPNPEFSHFAVAECGQVPIIIIYNWPTLEIICVLKGGAERTYTNVDFNPDGDLMVSQSGDPDYLITVWDWQNHTILLRTKSYGNDVYRVKFSPYIPGQITTCGVAHIKFWKMASTFTGLKLKGEIGRFGKTEYSDILGVLPMPDSKVVSGCDWGNILLWDDGLITFEVFRSLRRKCHEQPIVQFHYFDRELWSVSMDGHVKVWWFEQIDQADPPDDDRVILVDPTYDFYTPGVKLMAIEKRRPTDQMDTFWYAQDGNGGLWLIDLNTEKEPQPAEQLYSCHGGKVVSIAACPFGPYLASLGEAGQLFLFDYLNKTRIYRYKFPSYAVCMLWIPLDIDPTGEIILTGFEDGQIRVCCLKIPKESENLKKNISLTISQIIKPHNRKLTAMSINKQGSLLVTTGEDSTIFVFKVNTEIHSKYLTPIGFIPTTDIVSCITWHYEYENIVLVGCIHGQMMEIQLPEEEQPYTDISFRLFLDVQLNCFKTYKSQIKRDIKIKEIEERKAKKVAKKREHMEQVKKDNPGLEIDEEAFLADSESEEELEPLFIPEVPNRIIWLKYTDKKNIWLSMGGYDAGYIYEYRINQKELVPLRFRLIDGAEEMEISTYLYTHQKDYLIFAMQDGSIRINKTSTEDYTDLSDYFKLSMHDNQNGFIPKLCFSYDEKYLFSCGYDGNLFSYKFQPKDYTYPSQRHRRYRAEHTCAKVDDTKSDQKLSLEETKIKAENDKIQKLANEHKQSIREILKTLKERYKKLLQRNAHLLPSQIIPHADLEPDERVAEYVDQSFIDKIDIVNRKLAYDVEKSKIQVTKLRNYFTDPCDRHTNLVQGINKPGCAIMTVRQRKMPPIFYAMYDVIEQKKIEDEGKGRPPERIQTVQKSTTRIVEKTESPLEFFLLSLSPSIIQHKLGPKLKRVLDKYRKRRNKWQERTTEWEHFMAKKPIPGKNHPDDEKFLAEAKISFGDYKLKESPDYKVNDEDRETTVKHYRKLLDTRGKQYNLRHNFIEEVFKIRDYKYELIEKLKEEQKELFLINEELPKELWKVDPPIPKYDPNEFPEEKLIPKIVLPVSEMETEDSDIVKEVFVECPTGDELEKQTLQRKGDIKYENGVFSSNIPCEEVFKCMDLTFNELANIPEDVETPFESYSKVQRLNRQLFNQTLKVLQMEEMINDFNNWIYMARKERLPILIGGNFIDIYMVCVNEELQILKNSEAEEFKLLEIVNNKLSELHDMEDILDTMKAKKEGCEKKIENLKSDELKIHERFKMAAENNKFFDFLKKVFRKKYRPPKMKTDDEQTSSSSSSSSEESDYEEDEGSIDSRDFGFMKQDINVCPKGCEPALFNLTVELRTTRHEIEQTEREEVTLMEITKKNIDIQNKKMAKVRVEYQECVNTLEEFRREKQKKLNNVRCTVVLHIDQIYGFNPESSDISDFLVFPKSKLTSLYNRVGLLQSEALDEQSKHDTYLTHLMRLHKDLIYMKRKVSHLKMEIVSLLKEKFGKVVDINELERAILQRSFQKNYVNELEEVLLKKMVYDLRIKMTDVKGLYIDELEHWQRKIVQCQIDLAKELKENTKRLELLTVMNKEKKELAKFVDSQQRKKEKLQYIETIHKDFMKDMKKLEEIAADQQRTLQDLREEIKLLKTKGMAQEVLKRKETIKERERTTGKPVSKTEEEEIKQWIQYDEYVSEQETEDEEDKEQIKKRISIPGYYSTQAEDIITELVENLMQDVGDSLKQRSTHIMVQNILTGMMKCISIQDIIGQILDNIPIELDEKQRQSVGDSAEKLFILQEPVTSEERIMNCVKEILDETISEVLCHDPHYLIPTIIERLLDALPIEIISSEKIMAEIVLQIKESIQDIPLDKQEFSKSLDRLPSAEKNEILDVVNFIIEQVYGTGIDYLYVIPKK